MNIVVASVVYVNVIHVVLLIRKTTIARSTVLVLVAIHT